MYTLNFSGFGPVISNNYFPPIPIKGNYVIGLTNFSTYNTIRNVHEKNNYIKIGLNRIEIPFGAYEVNDLNNYIKKTLKKIKPDLKFDLKPNINTQRCEMYSSEPIFFDEENNIGALLGFHKRNYAKNRWHEGETLVDIMSVNEIRVICNIAKNSYQNSEMCRSLYNFPLDTPPGYKLVENPRNTIYLPITSEAEITNVTLRVEDQDGNLVDFQDPISINLHLKPENL